MEREKKKPPQEKEQYESCAAGLRKWMVLLQWAAVQPPSPELPS